MGVARASFQFLVEEEAIRQLTGYAHLSLAVGKSLLDSLSFWCLNGL